MRVAVYHNIPTGGAKRVVCEHCRGLTRAGHEVVLFEPVTGNTTFCDPTELGIEVQRVPLDWREGRAWHGLARVPGALHNMLITRGAYGRLAATEQRIASQVDDRGFDLLYVHHDLYETAPSVLRFARTPSVYFCQEPARAFFEAPIVEQPLVSTVSASALWRQAAHVNPLTSYIHNFRILNERTNTLAADWVLCNSAYSAESILRAHGRSARVCRLGADTDLFAPEVSAPRARAHYVLSAGALHQLKGFRFLIRALGRMPEEIRPELVLVGDRAHPDEPSLLEALARERGVTLTIHQRISDEELRNLYRGACVFVYAPYLEPLGLTALEAMACGTPVLGVREGGVRETVLDGVTGRLVERDEGLFATALAEMLHDPAALKRMGRQAREHVCSNWTWEQSVQHLLTLFDEFLAQTR